MIRALYIPLLLSSVLAAQVVDRVAATVNGQAILVSEVDDAARFAALLEGKPPQSITDRDRAAALERLIDQQLVRQRISTAGLLPASEQEIATRSADIRRQLSADNADAWRAMLARYSLSDADFREHLRSQLDQLRFIEMRFRPNAHVSPPEIEAYYRDQYAAKMRAAGAAEKPLNEVRAQIEEILIEQQVERLLDDWLQALRSEAKIRVLVHFGEAGGRSATAQEGSGR